jgi:hypothetical protein
MANGGIITDYLEQSAGPPSGTPSLGTSTEVALDVDTTNNALYFWNPTGTPAWHSAGGAATFSWSTKTTTYTITTSDTGILADATSGAFTVTLPTAVGSTARYAIKKKDASANTVTVATTSSQTIDGASTVVLSDQDSYVEVMSDGANWYVVGNGTPTTATALLGANVTMTTASAFYDALNLTLAPGTWLVSCGLTGVCASAAADFTARLWDGTTELVSGQNNIRTSTASCSIALSWIVKPHTSTTYTCSMSCDVAGAVISMVVNQAATAGNTATWMHAVRIK